MPCDDGGVPFPPTREEILDSKAPAMLCAILSAAGQMEANDLIERIDEKEAGVTKAEIYEWWDIHLRRDAARRRGEAQRAAMNAQAKAAWESLTPAQRKVLGLPAKWID